MEVTLEGKAYINGSFENCCIGIKNGKIHQLKKVLTGEHHINFGNNLVLPAGIDIHVHFREPGYTNKEDFKTGSLSAAYGGITCVFDMPNTLPPTTTQKAIEEKIHMAEKKSHTDFGIFAGINDDNITNIKTLGKKCSGFKIFLGETTKSFCLKDINLNRALKEVDNTKKISLIHAEDEKCLRKHKRPEQNLKDHCKNRPSECEETSIKLLLDNCKNISSKIHICHLSSCAGLETLKAHPKNISIGVTPHHLFFDVENINSKQNFFKVNPPIRTPVDRESLSSGISNGFIDILESDHAPHTLDEKEQEFEKAPSGIPGIETTYPLFLNEVKNQRLSFNRLISLMCEKPAELLKINKGKIEVGRDADLIVIDFKRITKIQSENLHYKCGWTPYEGKNGLFPSYVFLRGEEVIQDFELVASQGIGRNVNDFFP